jgi:metal-dependent amidase/aminoacylase/carboxypeptidase family protein
LTAYMERQAGWSVERHACELPTAWKAVYEVGQGGPIIGFNSESE